MKAGIPVAILDEEATSRIETAQCKDIEPLKNVCVHMHLYAHLKICSVCAWLTDGLCETPDYPLMGSQTLEDAVI